MKYFGLIIYVISILIGMASIGINSVIYLISRNKLNKFYFLFLLSIELILNSLLVIFYSSVLQVNNFTVFYISRIILQAGLYLIFIILPIYYFYIIRISFKKYIFFFITINIFYLFVSIIILYLYFFKETYKFITTNLEFIIIIMSNLVTLYLTLLTFFNLNRILNKYFRNNFLIINIIQGLSIPICILEILLFKTCFSVPLFFIIYNVLFIFPTLFNINKIRINEEDNLSNLLKKNYGITEREKEIILLLKNGLSYNDIADKLFISFKTVETHIYSIYRKAGVKNRLQLFQILNPKN